MIRRALVAAVLVLVAGPWSALAQGPGLSAIRSVRMADSTTGWAQTADRLLRTTDGGAHWTDVSPPGTVQSGRLTVASAGASNAWVVPEPPSGGAALDVFHTADGGRTWTRARAAAQTVGQLTFIDARRGWMTVDLDNAAGSEALRVLRTTDGGRSWTEAARTDSPGQPARSGLPFEGDKTGFAFLDARTGWMAGSIPRDNYSDFYATRNAGSTWQRQTLSIPAGVGSIQFGLTPPFVFPPADAVLPAQLNANAQSLSVVYVTHDAGRRWTPTAPVPMPATAASFTTVRVGWLTDGGTLYATSDAGHHWAALPHSALFTDVTELNFISSALGWAVRDGTPSLLKTADGGRTWVAVR